MQLFFNNFFNFFIFLSSPHFGRSTTKHHQFNCNSIAIGNWVLLIGNFFLPTYSWFFFFIKLVNYIKTDLKLIKLYLQLFAINWWYFNVSRTKWGITWSCSLPQYWIWFYSKLDDLQLIYNYLAVFLKSVGQSGREGQLHVQLCSVKILRNSIQNSI